ETTALFWIGFLFCDQGDRAVEADGEDVVAVLEVRVDLAVLDVRAKAADAGNDRLAVFRGQSDFARQRQKAERLFEIDIIRRDTFRESGAFGLFDLRFFLAFLRLRRLDLLTELQVWPKAAGAQCHLEASGWIFAQHPLALYTVGAGRHLPREIAFWIV